MFEIRYNDEIWSCRALRDFGGNNLKSVLSLLG
jgi:hypothetical protein